VDVGIVSEDGADNDDNDTFLTMTLIGSSLFSAASVAPSSTDITLVSALGLQSLATQGGLTAHATIQYSTGLTSDIQFSVGAFSTAFTSTDFFASTGSWGKVTGVITDDTTTSSRFNFMTLNFYFTDSKLAGIEDTTLELRGFLKYVCCFLIMRVNPQLTGIQSKTGTRPTGNQSVSWIATLGGSSSETIVSVA
jgi:hypothetical protein